MSAQTTTSIARCLFVPAFYEQIFYMKVVLCAALLYFEKVHISKITCSEITPVKA